MRKMIWVAVLVLFPLFSTNAFGDGFNPPEPGERLSGPGIIGTLILTPSDESPLPGYVATVDINFNGSCKSKSFTFEYDGFSIKHSFESIQAEDLKDIRLPTEIVISSLPEACYPKQGPQPLIINTVSKFKNDGRSITADIVLLFVVPK